MLLVLACILVLMVPVEFLAGTPKTAIAWGVAALTVAGLYFVIYALLALFNRLDQEDDAPLPVRHCHEHGPYWSNREGCPTCERMRRCA